ncbi:MAG TPA: hypothetical protein VF173_06105 [Thermoanaerobaculia bacterium]|nr:hypothetical protein [Thermoanaerobaculia bacterium]
MTNQRTAQFELVGNLGGDPEIKTRKGRPVTCAVYDEVLDDLVAKEFMTEDQELYIASLAVRVDDHGEERTVWKRLVDFQGHLKLYRKGDCISVFGYLRTRTYTDKETEEKKEVREFVVTRAKLIFAKKRQEVA